MVKNLWVLHFRLWLYSFRGRAIRATRCLFFRVRGFFFPKIHHADDCRGLRDVYVDGVKIASAVYANEKTGEVRYHGEKPQINRVTNTIVEHTIHGKVEIKWLDQSNSA